MMRSHSLREGLHSVFPMRLSKLAPYSQIPIDLNVDNSKNHEKVIVVAVAAARTTFVLIILGSKSHQA